VAAYEKNRSKGGACAKGGKKLDGGLSPLKFEKKRLNLPPKPEEQDSTMPKKNKLGGHRGEPFVNSNEKVFLLDETIVD